MRKLKIVEHISLEHLVGLLAKGAGRSYDGSP